MIRRLFALLSVLPVLLSAGIRLLLLLIAIAALLLAKT